MSDQPTIPFDNPPEEERVFPKNTNYLVSESGKVRRVGSTKYLNQCVLKRGKYRGVSLWSNNKGKMWTVHQVVAFTFRGERPSRRHHAAHDDGNKENNHWSNIFWKTKEENEADKIKHGTTNRGSRNGMSKLTDEQTPEIIRS